MDSAEDGVALKRTKIDVNGATVDGWAAEFDGTVSTAISREGALRQLVKAVGQEAL